MSTPTNTTADSTEQVAQMGAQIDALQLQLAAWAEAAARDQAEHSPHTRKLVWGLLEQQKLAERADMMADARRAERRAEQRRAEAARDRDRAEAELRDLRLLLGDMATGPLARRLAVAREVWALAWNARELLSIGGRTGFDAAMAQLDILLENKEWDGRPASYPDPDGDPIPAIELARPSAALDGGLLGRIVHAARARAARAGLWDVAAKPWDDLSREQQSLCEWLGQVLAIAGAGGALARAHALAGALDDASWLLRCDPHGAGPALALTRIDASLADDDADRTAGTTRHALEAVAAAAAELRSAIASYQDGEVAWMRDPGPRVAALDMALDAYDQATANGADLVASAPVDRLAGLALSALAAHEREQAGVALALLLGAPLGEALGRHVAALLRDARRSRVEGGDAEGTQSN